MSPDAWVCGTEAPAYGSYAVMAGGFPSRREIEVEGGGSGWSAGRSVTNPREINGAPKMMNKPVTISRPRRTRIRPARVAKPMAATEIVPMAAATAPDASCSNQRAADNKFCDSIKPRGTFLHFWVRAEPPLIRSASQFHFVWASFKRHEATIKTRLTMTVKS